MMDLARVKIAACPCCRTVTRLRVVASQRKGRACRMECDCGIAGRWEEAGASGPSQWNAAARGWQVIAGRADEAGAKAIPGQGMIS